MAGADLREPAPTTSPISGAKGDGQALATIALQQAIDACHKGQGGTVLVPAGVFVIGTVELKSNVCLHIAAQGKLLGSADGKQYHAADAIPLRGDSTLGDGNVGLIFAVEAPRAEPRRPPAAAAHNALIMCCCIAAGMSAFASCSSPPAHSTPSASFSSCKFVTIANSTFSTRWPVFRFGGGNPQDIAISKCIVYETYGCPIKMHFGPESQVRNIVFFNLVLRDVTGPISIDLNNRGAATRQPMRARRRKAFRGIFPSRESARMWLAEGAQFADMNFAQNYRPGETRQRIVLNAIGDCCLEDIVLDDVRVTYGGGGTAAEAQAQIPQVAGEYFEVGTPPAYGLYARNVRGLALHNVRFQVVKPDLRPAVVLLRLDEPQQRLRLRVALRAGAVTFEAGAARESVKVRG